MPDPLRRGPVGEVDYAAYAGALRSSTWRIDRSSGVVDDVWVSSPDSAPGVTVSVRLGARLGPGHRTVRLAAGATVAELLAALGPELGLDSRQLAGVAVAIAGEVVGHGRALADGEAVVLVLPVAGG